MYKLLSGLPDVEGNAEYRKEYLYEISEQRKKEAVESGEYSYKEWVTIGGNLFSLRGLQKANGTARRGIKYLLKKSIKHRMTNYNKYFIIFTSFNAESRQE